MEACKSFPSTQSPEMPFPQRTLSCTPPIHCADVFKERCCGGHVRPAHSRLLCQGNWGTGEKGCSLQWRVKEPAWEPSCKAQGSDSEKISQARFLRFTKSAFLSPYTQYVPVSWVSPQDPPEDLVTPRNPIRIIRHHLPMDCKSLPFLPEQKVWQQVMSYEERAVREGPAFLPLL